ncbi:iron-containing redox enzyme family protein [Kribbella sandramycini]|uniref:Iron-containing redox enzyme family protein n=1 Tax=Kribbella sandramycini TaxID=60450 RepID=A0A7Y4P4H6_9ACTN|nr:iron-containing redox enzyme family protein [Kribbella sandramycini]MBB6570350.1 hypothetical protein [Kribbella sandramycini]NOL45214.1 iron-containing redox enzyme family protein [Kribbella sandramycini]
MRLPPARGPLSEWLIGRLCEPQRTAVSPAYRSKLPWADEDLQLSLWIAYELHYRGFEDAAIDGQWDPEVLAFRAMLEREWVAWLERECRVMPSDAPIAEQLRELVDAEDGPRLSAYVRRHATLDQFRQFVANKSVYQLKEADPHSFGIPRVDGPTKAALVEIQSDEYGGGRPERMHAELFRTTMRWLGLNDAYGNYVPEAPAVTLAVSNVMSLFAMHRRWTPALLGHLAALEMTSTLPNRQYAAGALRLGATAQDARYFTEHVEADAVHEQIAAHDLCGSYVDDHPTALSDVLFGASCALKLDNLFAHHLLDQWKDKQCVAS